MKQFLHTLLIAGIGSMTTFTSQASDTAYGYIFGSKSGYQGFVSFEKSAPQTLNKLTTNYGYIHPSAGEYVDGKIYCYEVEFGDISGIYADSWAVYDGTTFKSITSKTKPALNRVTDMAYDYTTNTMYALAENEYNTGTLNATSLCIVDMETGDYHVVGPTGVIRATDGYNREVDDALITLACDNNGELYAMSAYRYLYKVDKHTGAVTQAAPRHNLGTAAQFQSMAFSADGKLWWAQTHPDYGHFCEIDLETGVPGGFVDFHTDYEKLNKLGDDAQLTALFFKDKSVNEQAPLKVNNLTSSIATDDIHSVNLRWEAPEKNYKGDAATVTGYKVYRFGISDPLTDITDPSQCSFTDTEAPDGNTTYEVIPYNETGYGFPALTEIFSGADKLNAVENLSISLVGKDVTVTWEKPTSTQNGGYSDYDAITYDVFRVVGDSKTAVSQNQTETSFTETLPGDGTYSYIVEPKSVGITGESAQTESVMLSDGTAKLPYYTSFEDDGDGPQWTFINKNTGSYGWSITTSKLYSIDGKYAKAYVGGSKEHGDDWLISPAFELAPGHYDLDFWGNGSSYGLTTLDIMVGTDIDDLESFSIHVLSFNNEKVYDTESIINGIKGWKHIETGFDITEAGTYYLGFHNKTQDTYVYFMLDNLSLKYNPNPSAISDVIAETDITTIECFDGNIIIASAKPVVKAEVYDLQGRRVMAAEDSNISSIDASALNNGIYLVRATLIDGSAATAKIFIK